MPLSRQGPVEGPFRCAWRRTRRSSPQDRGQDAFRFLALSGQVSALVGPAVLLYSRPHLLSAPSARCPSVRGQMSPSPVLSQSSRWHSSHLGLFSVLSRYASRRTRRSSPPGPASREPPQLNQVAIPLLSFLLVA